MNRIKKFVFAAALVAALGVSLNAQLPVPAIKNGGELDRRLMGYQQVVLTNAQVLALWSTPVTLIPAQGSGTIIEVISGLLSYSYTGAYTSVSGNNLRLYYTSRQTGPAASGAMTMLGFLDATSAVKLTFTGAPADELATANTPVVIQNVNGNAYGGGNASNTLTVRVNFVVHNQ